MDLVEALLAEEGRLKAALNKRVYLEVSLIRAMNQVHGVKIQDVIRGLNRFRQNSGDGAPAPMERRPPPSVTLPDRDAPSGNGGAQPPPSQPPENRTRPQTPAREEPVPAVVEDEPPPEAQPQPQTGKREESTPETTENTAPAFDVTSLEGQAPEKKAQILLGFLRSATARRTDTGNILNSLMGRLKPISYEGGTLELAFEEDLSPRDREDLQSDDMRERLRELLREAGVHDSPRVLVKPWVRGVSESDGPRLVSSPEVMERVRRNPFVQRTVDMFGGEIIDVRGVQDG